jgi:hypothetical protein
MNPASFQISLAVKTNMDSGNRLRSASAQGSERTVFEANTGARAVELDTNHDTHTGIHT